MTIFQKKTTPMTGVHLRRLVISAMFLAIALVLRTFFRVDIPLFGASGLRISIHGIFSTIPAILFGPVYGAIVSGLTDFIGFQLRPDGAWIPYITMTAALGGFVRGGLWMLLRSKNTLVMRACVAVFALVMLGTGVANTVALARDGVDGSFFDYYTIEMSQNAAGLPVRTIDHDRIDITGMSPVSRMAITRSLNVREPNEMISEFIMFITTAMIGTGILGFALLLINWAADKFLLKGQAALSTMSLLVAMMSASVLVSTLNTWILRFTIPAWQHLPFSFIWLPRVMQTVATTIVITYFVAVLLGVLKHQPMFKELIK